MSARRIKGIFVGYASNSTSYLVYHPESGEVYSRRYADVEFDQEPKAPQWEAEVTPEELDQQLEQLDHALLPVETSNSTQPTAAPTPVAAASPNNGPGITTTGDGRFFRTNRNMTVAEISRLLNQDPDQYLLMCRQYDGWYQGLHKTSAVVNAGSDMPIPDAGTQAETQAVASPSPAPEPTMQQGSASSGTPDSTTCTGTCSVEAQPVEIEGVRRSGRARRQPCRLMNQAMAALDKHKEEMDELTATALFVAHSESRGWSQIKDEDVLAMMCLEHEMERQRPRTRLEIAARAATAAPRSYRKAHQGPDSDKWRASELEEWNGLWKRGTFKDVKYNGQKLHHLLWTYKIRSDNSFKSRICIDGRQQDPSTYDNIRSPALALTAFRLLLSKAATNHWDVYADDASQAFVNAYRPEDRPLYASYPVGFKKPGHCMLVRRQLYGAHDAPKAWFDLVKKHLEQDQGLKQSETCETLFTGPGLWVIVHVDDFCSTGEDAAVAKFRRELHAKFEMTGGKVREYYGLDVEVRRKQGTIDVRAESYIKRLVSKLKRTPKPVYTPLAVDTALPKMDGECSNAALQRYYRTLVGSIMHPAVTCRPDVAAAARTLSLHLQHPTQVHVSAALRVVDYLWTTRRHSLRYGTEKGVATFYGTCDAAHNATHNSRGVTGWCYNHAGGAVAWKSRTQDLVSLSSCESELIAVDEATRELRYLLKLLKDFGINAHKPVLLGQDNMGTLTLIKGTHFNARTRHIALRYHHCGEQQRVGVLEAKHLPTDQMSSDVLTKPLSRVAHERHTQVLLGHHPIQWEVRDQRRHKVSGQELTENPSSLLCAAAIVHTDHRQANAARKRKPSVIVFGKHSWKRQRFGS